MRLISLTMLLFACSQPAQEPLASFTMPLPNAEASPPTETVIAKWGDQKLTYGELITQVEAQLTIKEIEFLNARYKIMRGYVENHVNNELLLKEAKKRGLADADALRAELSKVPEPTEAEIQAFYEENKRQMRGQPLDAVKAKIIETLKRTKISEATNTLIETLRANENVEISLEMPDLPRIKVSADDDYFLGPENAPITIIEFAEYQCPYCGRGYNTLKELMTLYDGKIKWVYRDYPLAFHKQAIPAAVAANCAGKQGKYWEMHDLMMDDQKAINDETMLAYANKLSLDIEAWKTCLTSEDEKLEVSKDMTDGQLAGVTGTPAYFVNGIMLSGAQPIEAFKAIIDKELAN